MSSKFSIFELSIASLKHNIEIIFSPAKRDLPKFKLNDNDLDGNGIPDDQEGPQAAEPEEKSLPVEFSDKTNQLLEYIEKNYLKGLVGAGVGDGKQILEKMKLAEMDKNSNKVCCEKVKRLKIIFLVFRQRPWTMDLTIYSRRVPPPPQGPWSLLWRTSGS